jgi:hypothetical protein
MLLKSRRCRAGTSSYWVQSRSSEGKAEDGNGTLPERTLTALRFNRADDDLNRTETSDAHTTHYWA